MILAARGVVVTLDLQMRDADGAVRALESVAAVVDFGAAWQLLICVVATVAAFFEVGFLLGGRAWVRADHYLGKLDWCSCRKGGDFVDVGVETVMVCDLREVGIPNAVVDRRLQNPAICGG